MQISLTSLVLLALPLVTPAAALPASTNAEVNTLNNNTRIAVAASANAERCRVNSMQRDVWVELGLSRWRTTFSAIGTDPAAYCEYWYKSGCGSNVQCGWDANVDGGWWRVDANFPRGAPGDAAYWKCLGKTRESWMRDSECATG